MSLVLQVYPVVRGQATFSSCIGLWGYPCICMIEASAGIRCIGQHGRSFTSSQAEVSGVGLLYALYLSRSAGGRSREKACDAQKGQMRIDVLGIRRGLLRRP